MLSACDEILSERSASVGDSKFPALQTYPFQYSEFMNILAEVYEAEETLQLIQVFSVGWFLYLPLLLMH